MQTGRRRREPTPRANSGPRWSRNNLWATVINLGPTMSLAGAVIFIWAVVVLLTVRELRTPGMVLLYTGLTLMGIPFVTQFGAVRKAVTARSGRYATNTTVMVLAFLSILGLIGYISYENSQRLDVTATQQFTLAQQTKKVVDELKMKVTARAYFDPEDARQELIKRRAEDYFYAFNHRNQDFSYEFIDPDLEPSQARRDGVTEYPTLVFESEDTDRNPYRLTPIYFEGDFSVSEQDLVSSLLIATGELQKIVYFTTGHREHDTGDAKEDSSGFGFARAGLVGDNYTVATINLKQVETIPEDAAVLVIAGPKGSFLVDEREKIHNYLKLGGRAIFLIDDAMKTQLNKVLNEWGIDMPAGVILDLGSSVTGDPRSPIIRRASYSADHPITKPLDDSFLTETAAIQDIIKRAPEGLPPNPDELNISIAPLASTTIFSCTTVDADRDHCSTDDDIAGPHQVAIAIEALAPVGEDPVDPFSDAPKAAIVVIGDSDFASNRYYFALNNSDLFLNSVGWLAQKYDIISIRAKPQAFRMLVIDQKEFDFIRYSSWFLLPTGILLLAGITWWRRR